MTNYYCKQCIMDGERKPATALVYVSMLNEVAQQPITIEVCKRHEKRIAKVFRSDKTGFKVTFEEIAGR